VKEIDDHQVDSVSQIGAHPATAFSAPLP
jgi:hypothetical protein